jgi:hypothetical protein
MNKQHNLWADSDPEKEREGLRESAGALKGVDFEALTKSRACKSPAFLLAP